MCFLYSFVPLLAIVIFIYICVIYSLCVWFWDLIILKLVADCKVRVQGGLERSKKKIRDAHLPARDDPNKGSHTQQASGETEI